MKKCATLAAVLLLCAGSAYAYENDYAGYNVKDDKPFFKLESKKTYAYTDMSSKKIKKNDEAAQDIAANIINYYTKDDMTQILGTDFSTAYFEAEWDRLAVLKRSDLSLQTIPTPLLDLDKYAAYDHNGNVTIASSILKKKLEDLTPVLKLQKIGKQKVITISYLYKQGDEVLVDIDTTLLSANDRLYMLTTVNTDHELYAPKKDEKSKDSEIEANTEDAVSEEDIDTETNDTAVDIKAEIEKSMQVENVSASSVPQEVMQHFAKAHSKMLKGFKAIAPTSTPKQLSFTDACNGKTFVLPEDWFYGQASMDIEKTATAHFAVAGSMTEMEQIVANLNYDNIYTTFATNSAATDQTTALVDAYMEQMDKSLKYWNSLLITASFNNISDANIKESLATPVANKLAFESFIDGGLERLKGFNSEDFTLNSYQTNYDFTREKANVGIDTDFTLLKHYNYHGKVNLACHDNMAGALVFIQKDGSSFDEALKKQIDAWQF